MTISSSSAPGSVPGAAAAPVAAAGLQPLTRREARAAREAAAARESAAALRETAAAPRETAAAPEAAAPRETEAESAHTPRAAAAAALATLEVAPQPEMPPLTRARTRSRRGRRRAASSPLSTVTDALAPIAQASTEALALSRPVLPERSAAKRRIRFPSPAAVRQGTRIGFLAAMAIVGTSVVSTSVPANAYYVASPDVAAARFAAATASDGAASDSQSFTAASGVTADSTGRDGYKVTAASPSASVSTAAAGRSVQWPFPGGSPISSGFGGRHVANCGFCSTNHQGLDFTPGFGTPIHVVASGVVSRVESGGAYGYNVWVDHVIDGRPVTTGYAHMKAGSITVAKGQRVSTGQVIGLVGSTGNSTGAHMHFEVHLAGRAVDPLPWLRAQAG